MSEVEAIAKMVTGAALSPVVYTDERGVQHAFRPKITDGGRMVEYIREEITPRREILPKPAFIDQLVNIDHASSLVDYVNRFKTGETVIFADTDELEIHAIIDYHKADSAAAGLVEHRAVLKLSHSAEWETWQAINKRMYDQKAFAKLIDINSEDVISPAGAALLEQVMDLEMTSTVTVQRKLMQSGSSRGEGGVARKVDGTVLPAFFLLSIPVFTGEMPVELRAQTLDNLDANTGKISLGLELVRTRIVIEKEVARIANAIAVETAVPVIMGSLADHKS